MDDMLLARGEIEGGWNLSPGEPKFLQNELHFPEFKWDGALQYPKSNGDPELIKEIRQLHPTQYVVIANGAKQALSAAFFALKSEGKTEVRHLPPYWVSFPTLAKLQGLYFNKFDQKSNWINLETLVNNPDGREYMYELGPVDILDCVYGHWVYGWSGKKYPDARIYVSGAAKLLGLSGVRVGWLLTDDKKLAEEAAKYIEFTTSGVSVLSQKYVAHCLRWMRNSDSSMQLYKARETLMFNGDICLKYLVDIGRMDGVPKSGKGMFAWLNIEQKDIKRFDEALKKSKVSIVTGTACGWTEGFYRISMGNSNDYTEQALKALKEAL